MFEVIERKSPQREIKGIGLEYGPPLSSPLSMNPYEILEGRETHLIHSCQLQNGCSQNPKVHDMSTKRFRDPDSL